jgi:hypothetical protein
VFQARFADFLVQISGTRSGGQGIASLIGGGVRLKVTALSGAPVDDINSIRSLGSSVARPPAPQVLINKIQELYDLVSDESEDLNRLLKAIG